MWLIPIVCVAYCLAQAPPSSPPGPSVDLMSTLQNQVPSTAQVPSTVHPDVVKQAAVTEGKLDHEMSTKEPPIMSAPANPTVTTEKLETKAMAKEDINTAPETLPTVPTTSEPPKKELSPNSQVVPIISTTVATVTTTNKPLVTSIQQNQGAKESTKKLENAAPTSAINIVSNQANNIPTTTSSTAKGMTPKPAAQNAGSNHADNMEESREKSLATTKQCSMELAFITIILSFFTAYK